jgi:FAD dependent oxidoreductase TIGR03364
MMEMATRNFDIAIIGAGIIGLAHAYCAARRGKRVVVIDKDVRANGASIRNFGFITVTGQERGLSWELARQTRDAWAEIAPKAGIPILQQGLVLTMRYPESLVLAQAFLKTEMGDACHFLTRDQLMTQYPEISAPDTLGALVSPHELRVESRTAIPLLTSWLHHQWGVTFMTETAALAVDGARIQTSQGDIHADAAIICPGDDFTTLYPERLAKFALRRCRLSMLRLAASDLHLTRPVMSDLSLVRYRGYAALPEAAPLLARLKQSHAEHLDNGVHLIAVQSADGSLVVGDSHHYDKLPDPFAPTYAETLILDEFQAATGCRPADVIERWVGTYAVADDRTFLMDAPNEYVRIVIVTSGTGASTCFGIAERTLTDLFGPKIGARS